MTNANTRSGRLLSLAILLVAVLLFFAPLPRPGTLIYGFDTVQEQFPWQSWIWGEWKVGRVPAWNSHLSSGFPFLANSNASPLYPPNALHLFFPTEIAMDLSILVHLLLTGAGMLAFLGVLGCSAPAALAGALAWMLSGFTIGRIFHGSFAQLYTLCWTPWLFWCVERAVRVGTVRAFLPGAGILGIALLAGHPQYALHLIVASAVWTVARTPARARRRTAAGWFAMVVAAVLIGAAQLFPLAEFFLHSSRRAGLSMPNRWLSSLPPWQLLNLLAPGFFGDEITTPYWGQYLHGLVTPYVGILALMAAPAARRVAPRSAFWSLVALGLAGLVLAMPASLPPVEWLHSLPPLSFFRLPSRWLHLFAFAAACLCGLGVEAWIRPGGAGARARVPPLWGPIVWVAAAALTLILFTQGEFEGLWRSIYETAIAAPGALLPPADLASRTFVHEAFRASLGAAAAALGFATLALTILRMAGRLAPRIPLAGWLPAAAVALELVGWSGRYVIRVPVPAPLPDLPAPSRAEPFRIASLLPLKARSFPGRLGATASHLTAFDQGVFHLFALEGLDTPQAAMNSLLRDYLDIATGGPPLEQGFVQTRPVLDLLNVRYLVAPVTARSAAEPWTWNLPDEATDLTEGLVFVRAGPGYRLYENPRALPRAFVVHEVTHAMSPEEGREIVRSPRFDPRRTVALVDRGSAGRESAAAKGIDLEDEVRWLARRPGQIGLATRLTEPGFLVVSECHFPGWEALVDDGPAPVLAADVAFLGVALPAGEHRVELRYVPRAFRVGLAVSLATLLAAAAAAARGAAARRGRTPGLGC